MLETIALIVLSVSVLVFLYSLTALKKPSYSGAGKQQSMPSPDPSPLKMESKRAKIAEPMESEDWSKEMVHESMPSTTMDDRMSERLDLTPAGPSDYTSAGMGAAQTFERKASLIYWERMCLEEEFDLIVSLHRPEFKVQAPDGASVHVSDDSYHLPTT